MIRFSFKVLIFTVIKSHYHQNLINLIPLGGIREAFPLGVHLNLLKNRKIVLFLLFSAVNIGRVEYQPKEKEDKNDKKRKRKKIFLSVISNFLTIS